MPNILISAGGRRGQLVNIWRAALASLQLQGSITVADSSPLCPAGYLADHLVIVPRIEDPSFITAIMDLCERYDIGMIVPTIDPELSVYSRYRSELNAAGVTVLISDPEVISLGEDKLLAHRWLTANGFNTPATVAAQDLNSNDPLWDLPLFAKPRRGSASVNAFRVNSMLDVQRAVSLPNMVFQRLANGTEYTVDVWVDGEGECRAVVPRRRLEVRSGEVSKAVTVRHVGLEQLVRRLVERLPGHVHGALNVQCFLDSDIAIVVEINARFGGGYPLAHRAGADFAKWALEDFVGISSTASNDWQENLVMLRYDDAVFVDSASLPPD